MAEEEEDPADVHDKDKAWMNEARDLSYDMEDSIDDFIMQTIISGDNDVDEPDHGKDFKEEIIGFLKKVNDLSGTMKGRHQVGGDFKEETVEVVHAAADPAALAMFELLSKRDEPKTELLKLLTQDEDEGCELLLAEVADGCETPLVELDGRSELLQVEDECDLAEKEEEEQQQQEQEQQDEEEQEQQTEDGCDQSPLAEEDDGCDSLLAEKEDGCESPLVEEDEEDKGCEWQTRKHPKVVTIVGAGGTALANQVYEELRVKFDYWSFISLSPNPELAGILTMLLLEFTGEYKETGSMQQLIDEIKDFLLDKR
jgi:hypothetical protein